MFYLNLVGYKERANGAVEVEISVLSELSGI